MMKNNNLYDKPKEINNFHEIEDFSERRAHLEYLSENQEASGIWSDITPEDAKRYLELFDNRYEKKNNQWVDNYMRAFMMLMTLNRASAISFLNGRRRKEIESYLTALGAYSDNIDSYQLEEWKDFAACYITSCTSSKTYGTAFLGIIPMPDKNVGLKIAGDIDTALHEVPESYDLFEKSKPIYKIFKETYCILLQNGEKLWNEYMATRSN
ncbi:DUF6553 family protein [Butyrivibrio sp. XPD2002]|uniref:DUF6553 family protein n=1 Tax=Butyrivibrio sp. XPD2002 TaxID=1280665 RepID=UPI0004188A6B|nr:DUF6553 family protein [Butyrivibrio sp. XPD2002]